MRLCLIVVSLPHRKPVYLSTSTALGMTNYDITIVETFTRNTMVLCEGARARRGQHTVSSWTQDQSNGPKLLFHSLTVSSSVCLSLSLSLLFSLTHALSLCPIPPSPIFSLSLSPSLLLFLCFSLAHALERRDGGGVGGDLVETETVLLGRQTKAQLKGMPGFCKSTLMVKQMHSHTASTYMVMTFSMLTHLHITHCSTTFAPPIPTKLDVGPK